MPHVPAPVSTLSNTELRPVEPDRPELNLDRIRQEFPVVHHCTYLNHSAVGTLPMRAREAVRAYVEDYSEHAASNYRDWEAAIETARSRSARLINATPEQIAFVKNTTEGLCFAANGIDWRSGDNVVLNDLEFPSNVYPWLNLARHGVETRMTESVDGRLTVDSIAERIDARTRAVSISHVEFGNGFRNDLAAIGALCREKDICFVVDAIQSLGQTPVDVEEMSIDLLTADGHKWLLSPEGIGIFYCAPHLTDRLRLYEVGWNSVADAGNYDAYDPTPAPTARRFECGSHNTLGIYALGASLDLLLEVGIEAVRERLRLLTDRLVDGLRDAGYRVLSPRGESEWSGIVTFDSPVHETEALHRTLRSHQIIGARRGGGIRISPHFYNTEEEVLRVVDALPGH